MFSYKFLHRVKPTQLIKYTFLNRYFSTTTAKSLEDITKILEKKKTEYTATDFNNLLRKTNQIFDDKFMRIQRESGQLAIRRDDVLLGNSPQVASSIFNTSLEFLASSANTLTKPDVITALSLIGRARFSLEIPVSVIEAFEAKIISTISEYPVIDLISLVPYFASMNYQPRLIIEEINKEEKFVTVPNSTMKEFLVALIDLKFTSSSQLYLKIFEQLKLASTNMETNEVCLIFQRIREMQEIGLFEDKKLKDIFHHDIIDYFAFKLDSLHKRNSEPSNKNLIELLHNKTELQIDNDSLDQVLMEFSTRKIRTNFGLVIDSLEYLNKTQKFQLIQNILFEIKDRKVDIRYLNLNQLSRIMIHIIKINDSEILPFLKYMDKILSKDKEEDLDINLLSELFYEITNHGHDSANQFPSIYFRFINDICENYDELSEDLYIKVLWALAYTEEDDFQNPLIPILFEKLQYVELEKPLNDEESAYFYQVLLFVKEKIKSGHYPPEFEKLISEPVKKLAKKRYLEMDNCQHQDTKREMGKFQLNNGL